MHFAVERAGINTRSCAIVSKLSWPRVFVPSTVSVPRDTSFSSASSHCQLTAAIMSAMSALGICPMGADHRAMDPMLFHKFSDLRISSAFAGGPMGPLPYPLEEHPPVSSDPLTVQEIDLERRCLGTLTDALRAVVQYAHSSFRVPISFQVKRFDRAHGQIWVKVSPDEVPEGYDLKYLLQHIKFYENIPRYARLLNSEDYKLKATCQYFLDLQSRAASSREEGLPGDVSRLRDTISRASRFVQEMSKVGITDRDVVRQLSDALTKLRDLSYAVDQYTRFHQKQQEVFRLTGSWYPDKQQVAAREIHQQIITMLDDPDVVKYMLQVVGPRLGLLPVSATY